MKLKRGIELGLKESIKKFDKRAGGLILQIAR